MQTKGKLQLTLVPEPSQSRSSRLFLTKKGKRGIGFLMFYGRFLTIRTITMPTMKIARIMPTTAGTKYCSTSDCSTTGAAVGAGASPTDIAVSQCDGQYDFEPSNVAMTL